MTDQMVRSTTSGAVATITLDSPHNANALSMALISQLRSALDGALGDPSVRVIVLTGAGRVFCSGADLKEASSSPVLARGDDPPEPPATLARGDDPPEPPATLARGDDPPEPPATAPGLLVDVIGQLWSSDKPVICRVNGAARAGGIGLVASCDIAIAPTSATFAFSEVRIGVAPAVISVPCLRRMPSRAATEYFLTGAVFDATRAAEIGLLTRAVEPDELDAQTERYTDMLLRGAPSALAATKALLRDVPSEPVPAGLVRMAELSGTLFGSEEAREGIAAFASKRDPAWVTPKPQA